MTADQGRKCSEPGCEEKHRARGRCQRHYLQARNAGLLPPTQLMLGVHSLTNVDRDAKVADCLICGPQVPIRVRIRSRGWDLECRIKLREHKRKWKKTEKYRKYKLTLDEYKRMVASQQRRCAICQVEPSVLVVDHDHETGLVRGLLCHGCNCGIGFLRDDVDIITRAVEYLTAHNSKEAPFLCDAS